MTKRSDVRQPLDIAVATKVFRSWDFQSGLDRLIPVFRAVPTALELHFRYIGVLKETLESGIEGLRIEG